jgi:hypothetical protein
MRAYPSIWLQVPDILLPISGIDTKMSVIACDNIHNNLNTVKVSQLLETRHPPLI